MPHPRRHCLCKHRRENLNTWFQKPETICSTRLLRQRDTDIYWGDGQSSCTNLESEHDCERHIWRRKSRIHLFGNPTRVDTDYNQVAAQRVSVMHKRALVIKFPLLLLVAWHLYWIVILLQELAWNLYVILLDPLTFIFRLRMQKLFRLCSKYGTL